MRTCAEGRLLLADAVVAEAAAVHCDRSIADVAIESMKSEVGGACCSNTLEEHAWRAAAGGLLLEGAGVHIVGPVHTCGSRTGTNGGSPECRKGRMNALREVCVRIAVGGESTAACCRAA
jgi:hypothetical protein